MLKYDNKLFNGYAHQDKHYEYTTLRDVRFDCIVIGDTFSFRGTTYIKKSSRTALVQNGGGRWFYFSGNDITEVYLRKAKK